jgi:hypothetical protein
MLSHISKANWSHNTIIPDNLILQKVFVDKRKSYAVSVVDAEAQSAQVVQSKADVKSAALAKEKRSGKIQADRDR